MPFRLFAQENTRHSFRHCKREGKKKTKQKNSVGIKCGLWPALPAQVVKDWRNPELADVLNCPNVFG